MNQHREGDGKLIRRSDGVEMSVSVFEGAFPSPEALRKYEELVPGSAQRILEAGWAQTEHRIAAEKQVIAASVKSQSRAQSYALIAVLACLAFAAYAVYRGAEAAAIATVIMAIGAVAGVFVARQVVSSKERIVKEELRRQIQTEARSSHRVEPAQARSSQTLAEGQTGSRSESEP